MANCNDSNWNFEFVFDSDPDKLFEELVRTKLENKELKEALGRGVKTFDEFRQFFVSLEETVKDLQTNNSVPVEKLIVMLQTFRATHSLYTCV